MSPHLKLGAPQGSGIHESQQQILSQWISDQPAFKEVLSKLPDTDQCFSPNQIDAILATRRRIKEAKEPHD